MIKKLCLGAFITLMTVTNAMATENNNAKSGFFYAYNDTDKEVSISVGNIIPTKYTISAHNYKFILVSTDNQNIHIVSVK